MSKEVKRFYAPDYETEYANGKRGQILAVAASDYEALLEENEALKSQERYREQERLAAIEEVEKLKRELALWEPVIYEVHRRADKMCCLEDQYDFTVEIPYETYAAIDAGMREP